MGDMQQGTEAALAQDLKAFRKQFQKDHGRDPSRKDMNKHPAIATIYDEWLAIKSASSSSSQPRASSSSSTSSCKRKAPTESPRQLASARFSKADTTATLPMAPPPTTPSKKKPRQRYISEEIGLFKTPTKKNGSTSKLSPGTTLSSVHDSGGSVVDVPSSPKEVIASPTLARKHQNKPNNARVAIYESPTKLKDLLSSFSSIQRTPTKSNGRELSSKALEGTMPAYTPRTKARKRLRGEVVITPEKVRESEQSEEQVSAASSRAIVQPPQKRRRGMAMNTLKDYGIVSVAGPPKGKAAEGKVGEKGKSAITTARAQEEAGERYDKEEDEEDDEDDMLGPSPSLNRVVDRPVKAYQPLFGVEANGILASEDSSVEPEERDPEGAAMKKSTLPTMKKKVVGRALDDEDQDIVVVPYQRYKKSSNARQTLSFSDDEDEGMGFYDTFSAVAANGRMTDDPSTPPRDASSPHEYQEQTPSLLGSLSLHSPQFKRARNKQRVKAEKSVRQLIGDDKNLAILDEWDEGNHEVETGMRKVEPLAKSNKVGPAIKGGRLMKSAKNFKSIVGSNEKDKSNDTTDNGEKVSGPSSNLVFGNLREQLGSDQDSDLDANNEDSDEWASEVDSAEYGLGDGFMSDQD